MHDILKELNDISDLAKIEVVIYSCLMAIVALGCTLLGLLYASSLHAMMAKISQVGVQRAS